MSNAFDPTVGVTAASNGGISPPSSPTKALRAKSAYTVDGPELFKSMIAQSDYLTLWCAFHYLFTLTPGAFETALSAFCSDAVLDRLSYIAQSTVFADLQALAFQALQLIYTAQNAATLRHTPVLRFAPSTATTTTTPSSSTSHRRPVAAAVGSNSSMFAKSCA
jgi:hypothetical protein